MVHVLTPDTPSDLHEQAPSPARAGFVVSRAVGGAVDRNRVKRRLRHLCRDLLPELPAGSLLVVRALPAASAATYDELRHDLARGLTRALDRPVDQSTETGVRR